MVPLICGSVPISRLNSEGGAWRLMLYLMAFGTGHGSVLCNVLFRYGTVRLGYLEGWSEMLPVCS